MKQILKSIEPFYKTGSQANNITGIYSGQYLVNPRKLFVPDVDLLVSIT